MRMVVTPLRLGWRLIRRQGSSCWWWCAARARSQRGPYHESWQSVGTPVDVADAGRTRTVPERFVRTVRAGWDAEVKSDAAAEEERIRGAPLA